MADPDFIEYLEKSNKKSKAIFKRLKQSAARHTATISDSSDSLEEIGHLENDETLEMNDILCSKTKKNGETLSIFNNQIGRVESDKVKQDKDCDKIVLDVECDKMEEKATICDFVSENDKLKQNSKDSLNDNLNFQPSSSDIKSVSSEILDKSLDLTGKTSYKHLNSKNNASDFSKPYKITKCSLYNSLKINTSNNSSPWNTYDAKKMGLNEVSFLKEDVNIKEFNDQNNEIKLNSSLCKKINDESNSIESEKISYKNIDKSNIYKTANDYNFYKTFNDSTITIRKKRPDSQFANYGNKNLPLYGTCTKNSRSSTYGNTSLIHEPLVYDTSNINFKNNNYASHTFNKIECSPNNPNLLNNINQSPLGYKNIEQRSFDYKNIDQRSFDHKYINQKSFDYKNINQKNFDRKNIDQKSFDYKNIDQQISDYKIINQKQFDQKISDYKNINQKTLDYKSDILANLKSLEQKPFNYRHSDQNFYKSKPFNDSSISDKSKPLQEQNSDFDEFYENRKKRGFKISIEKSNQILELIEEEKDKERIEENKIARKKDKVANKSKTNPKKAKVVIKKKNIKNKGENLNVQDNSSSTSLSDSKLEINEEYCNDLINDDLNSEYLNVKKLENNDLKLNEKKFNFEKIADDGQIINRKSIHLKNDMQKLKTVKISAQKNINLIDILTSIFIEKVNFESLNFKNAEKIGEASFSDVYSIGNTIYKLIPLGDEFTNFYSFCRECYILNTLRGEKNTIGIKKFLILCGEFSQDLSKAWHLFKEKKGSENLEPENFPKKQEFGLIVMENGGEDLEKFKFDNLNEIKSFFLQLFECVGRLERKYEFEHRDLHWGNILLRRKGKFLELRIIDFSLSRLKSRYLVFTDLNEIGWIFEGDEAIDEQFSVYRDMKVACCSDWSLFVPKSNVLWIRYVINKIRIKCGRMGMAIANEIEALIGDCNSVFDIYTKTKQLFAQ